MSQTYRRSRRCRCRRCSFGEQLPNRSVIGDERRKGAECKQTAQQRPTSAGADKIRTGQVCGGLCGAEIMDGPCVPAPDPCSCIWCDVRDGKRGATFLFFFPCFWASFFCAWFRIRQAHFHPPSTTYSAAPLLQAPRDRARRDWFRRGKLK